MKKMPFSLKKTTFFHIHLVETRYGTSLQNRKHSFYSFTPVSANTFPPSKVTNQYSFTHFPVSARVVELVGVLA